MASLALSKPKDLLSRDLWWFLIYKLNMESQAPDLFDETESFFMLQLSDENNQEGINYYEEYCKLHVSNMLMNKKVNELREERAQLKERLERLNSSEGAARRVRRKAKEIVRHYCCEHCSKSYGSEASLKHHIKLKHQFKPE